MPVYVVMKQKWESGLSLIGTNHHFDRSSPSGSELIFQPHQVFDAVFAVKLHLGAILSEHWILASHKTIQVGTLEGVLWFEAGL